MKKLTALVTILLSALLPARATAPTRYDAKVAMSDGVKLDVSVYVPAAAPANADLPLVVRQHGGGSTKDNTYDVGYAMKFIDTGNFAVLMYSHRGHGNSEGLFDFFGPRTTKDFSEILDWIETQSFAGQIDTTNVGATGYSQGGGESLLPAEHDPRVKAVAVGQTFADLNHALNPNDCFKFSFATGIFAGAYKVAGARTQDDLAVRWGAQFYSDTEDVGAPGVPSTTEDLASRSPQTYVGALVERRVPVFWTQAWEDQLFPGDHPERVLEPLEQAGIPIHYWFSSGGHAQGPNFPDEETAREQAMLDWMDQFLRGVDHGFTTGPKVDYWQRVAAGRPGTWEHHTAPSWPLPGAQPQSWVMHGDRSLKRTPEENVNVLGTIANDYASLNVANDALINEVAGNIPGLNSVLASVPESANPLDTLTFASAPLAAPVDATGAPVASLRFVPTVPLSPQTVQQVDVKIWDVAPGSATLVWRGCDSISDPRNTPTIRFALWPNSHRFEAGHSIVVTVSSVDFPTFKPDVEPWVNNLITQSTITLPVTN